MKRIFCIFIAAALLLCTAACAPKGVDVFAEALSLTDFGRRNFFYKLLKFFLKQSLIYDKIFLMGRKTVFFDEKNNIGGQT